MSANALAQNSDTVHKDKSVKIIIRDPILPKDNRVLFIIDNKKFYTDDFDKMLPDTNNLLDVKVLKTKEAIDKYGKKADKGVVIICTKKYAINQYKEKFSTFSVKYKKYLKTHQNDDERLIYSIKGNLYGHDNESIKLLYSLPKDSIQNVALLISQDFEGIKTTIVDIEKK